MESQYFRENEWWVSPFNFISAVREKMDLPARVQLHDSTLRDGEQTPGLVFRKEDKIRIARKLDEVGVDRIEAGMPAVSDEDLQAVKEISRAGLKAKIFTFVRAMNVDIDKSVECGAHGVILEVPIGYPKLKYQFKWTWEDVLKKSVTTIKYARERGLYVTYFPYDTTRAREEDLDNLLGRLMQEAPPDSIGVVDTMGCALPEAIQYLVRKIKAMTSLPIEIHTHNDFGMAVATELAAVAAGAEVVHGCVNGLGERTGNAALEELIFGLHILLDFKGQYDFSQIGALSDLVQEISGLPLPLNKPIIGERNYTRESGIGVDMVVNYPLAMFGTDPRLTNREGKIVLGKKSGKASIEYNLEKMGLRGVGEEKVAELLKQVKAKGTEKRGLLTDEEFKQLADRVLG